MADYRVLKSELAIRLTFHQLEHRIKDHVLGDWSDNLLGHAALAQSNATPIALGEHSQHYDFSMGATIT